MNKIKVSFAIICPNCGELVKCAIETEAKEGKMRSKRFDTT